MSAARRKSINPLAGIQHPSPQTPTASNGSTTSSTRSRPRTSIVASPAISGLPSLSETIPFDWHAAKTGGPAPYATPLQSRNRNRLSMLRESTTPELTRRDSPKRVVRRKTFIQKVKDYPANLLFQIQMLPDELPLPEEKMLGRCIGALLHIAHCICRVKSIPSYRDSDVGWYDMYDESQSWFSIWSIANWLLIAVSCLATLHLFTRVRIYRLEHHTAPGESTPRLVDSPHAKFVEADRPQVTSASDPSPWAYTATLLVRGVVASWRFLLNQDLEDDVGSNKEGKQSQVQQLEVWMPKELHKAVFTVYSPIHAFLWLIWNFHNWMSIIIAMVILSVQLHILMRSYDLLLKDRAILSAEVMNEYDKKFVQPRIFPMRRDASTQTHEAEMVDDFNWTPRNRRKTHHW